MWTTLGKEIQTSLDKCVIHCFLFEKIKPSLISRFPLSSNWPSINDNFLKSECTNPPSQGMSSTIPMPKINYVGILGDTDLGKDDEF